MSENFKSKPYGAFVRKEVVCPDCRTDQFIKWRKGVKRFRSRRYHCKNEDCGFAGYRGEWEWLEDMSLEEMGAILEYDR